MSRRPAEVDLSVVIPAHNAARTIAPTLRSVFAQRRPCREVIVVDDGSSDGTADAARAIADPRVQVLVKPNGGPSSAKNVGVAAARCRYIAFLDSDDLWLPSYTEAVLAALERIPGAGLAYTDAWVFDGRTRRVRRRTAMQAPDPPPAEPEAFLAELLRRNFIFTSATIPADVLEHVGGFPEARLRAEEYDLWLRIALAGFRAAYAPGPHALYRQHPGQLSEASLEMTRELHAVLTDVDPARLPTPALHELLLTRRRQVAQSVRAMSGEDPRLARRLRLRRRAGRLRRALGLSQRWYAAPPARAAEALALLDPPASTFAPSAART